MSIIKVDNLSKTFQSFKRREGVWGSVKDLFQRTYEPVKAVEGLSLSVEKGELLGYIGPNGAGKSTSIKMLTGILKPSGGEMSVMNFHPFRDRRQYTQHIGVVFGQRTQLWWDIALVESFKLLARIYRVSDTDYRKRVAQLTEVLALEDILHVPVRKLSLGQRMRADLAASLIHGPEILFLDEPTIGLDAVAKDSIRGFLRFINNTFQTTIILTTHDLREIEELCQRIVVIDKGHKVYDGSLEAVRNMSGLRRSLLVDFVRELPPEEINLNLSVRLDMQRQSERRLEIKYDSKEVPTGDLLRALLANYEVAELSVAEPNIEDVIMKLYREGLTG